MGSGHDANFGLDANAWCNCQDHPDKFWKRMGIQDVLVKDSCAVELKWHMEPKDFVYKDNCVIALRWNMDGKVSKDAYPMELIKENGRWKILSLYGFDKKHYK